MADSTQTSATAPDDLWHDFVEQLPDLSKVTVIRNKADISGEKTGKQQVGEHTLISLSAKNGEGIDLLREHLKDCMGFQSTTEGGFMARRRHLDALERAHALLQTGRDQLEHQGAGELLAEDLRQAQQVLNEITGEFSSDDLLGRIFSSFCIGK
jgi:tRNA modification GTPase